MKKLVTSLAFVIGMSSQIVACSIDATESPKNPDDGTTPPAATTPEMPKDPMAPAPTPAAGKAVVRVIHASADAPSVDVYPKGKGEPIITALTYGQTSGWLELDPGTYVFELRAAGAKPTDPIAYRTPDLVIPAGAKISAVAAGLLSAKDSDAAFRVVPVVEGFGAAEAGKARLRVLHAGSDAPSVDLDVGNDDPTMPELKGLARFSSTGAEGVALPADSALAVGIAAGGNRVTAFTTPKLPAGANVLVIATGLLGKLARQGDGFALLAIGPSGSLGFIKQDPIVYGLHGSPNAPRVDAFVGNAEIIDNVGFGEITKPIQVPPGTYDIDWYAHVDGSARPASAAAASTSTGKLEPGERYLAIATGFLGLAGLEPFRLAAFRESFALDTGKAQLRAVHSSPDAPMVDIGLANGTKIDPVLYAGLSFGQSSVGDGLSAPSGNLLVGVTPASVNTSIVARVTVASQMQQRAFVIAAGALGAGRGQGFRFLTVDTAKAPWTVTASLPH